MIKKFLFFLILFIFYNPTFVFGHAMGFASITGKIDGKTLTANFKFPDEIFTVGKDVAFDFFNTNFKAYSKNSLCSMKIQTYIVPTDAATFVFTCPDEIEELKIRSELSQNLGYTYAGSFQKGNQVKNYTFDMEKKDFEAVFNTQAWLKDLVSKVYDFVRLGMFHIYTGYDHILFLLAVIIVLSSFGRIIKAATAFTIAHSTTLILAAFGSISLTSRIVEPIIALSIAYVAFENIFRSKSSHVFQRRWLVVFGFGLIHGLGFAGALSEINIPRNELLVDLVSFNIGIELGQLSIIAVFLPILYFLNRFGRLTASRFITALSILIGSAGGFWFLERIGILVLFQSISFETWMKSLPITLIFLGFFFVQIGILKNLRTNLLNIVRKLFVLTIAVSLTVAFIPGIFNLKPQKAYAAVPSGVIVAWPSTNASIPSGWSRVTGLDSRFTKMIATSGTNPGGTGGASSHNHSFGSHTHPVSHNHTGWPNSTAGPAGADWNSFSGPQVIKDHTHTMSSTAYSGSSGSGGPANWDSTGSEPASLTVIFIKSDGTPTGIPNSALAYYNGAAPTGWAAYANGANRLLKGAATGGNGGGTVDTSSHTHGSAAHDHSLPAHTHTLTLDSGTGNGINTGGGGNLFPELHTHTAGSSSSDGATTSATASPTNDAGDTTPPWFKVLPVQNTSGSNSFPVNLIAIWDGTLASIPVGWKLCDGTNCTLNLSQDKYVRGAANSGEISNTGGATTHSHTGGAHTHTDGGVTHTHTGSGTSGSTTPATSFKNWNASDQQQSQTTTHNHPIGTAASGASTHGSLGSATPSTGSAGNDPTYTTVAYIQLQTVNQNPNASTIKGSSPIAGSKPNKSAGTVTLQGSATDPDVSDTVQIDWDYSANSGGAWTNIGTTALGTQGTTLSLTWTVSGLTAASTYRLRARTIDNGGAASAYTTQTADWTLTSGCSPPIGGSMTISSSCAFPETIDGVDNGNITINSTVTLTVNSGQTVVLNNGTSITLNGSVAVNSTGQIRQTNLWMLDADADGWPANVTQSGQDSTPGVDYRRRNLLNSDRVIDCNDAATSSTNSC